MMASLDAFADNVIERLFDFFKLMISGVGTEAMATLANNTDSRWIRLPRKQHRASRAADCWRGSRSFRNPRRDAPWLFL